MKTKSVLLYILLLAPFLGPVLRGAEYPFIEKQILFEAGGGYPSIRIPCILALPDNTVLAVAAGRSRVSDWADIDMILRRSTDGGKTWGPVTVLADAGTDVADNPVLLWDRDTKTVHFLHQVDYARVYHRQSADGGKTFSPAVEITPQLGAFKENYNWTVIAPGPGHGIQLKNGRLVVPVWLAAGKQLASGHGRAHQPSVTTSIYSDDHGKTWQCGGILPDTLKNMNETVAVPTDDGGVMFIIRNGEPGAYSKAVSRSPDGATGWTKPELNKALYSPICFGSALRISGAPDKSRILFCNPDSHVNLRPNRSGNGRARMNLTVKLSYDEGRSWPASKVIEPAHSSYSDLAMLPDGTILCLYENANKYVSLARFNLEWLTDVKDSLPK
jgi:sialidase-1